jgi:2-phosphoglycerate kinase
VTTGADPRVILIGGSSHAGKSSLARRLAARPGWTSASTDHLGRHPGRPWRPAGEAVPAHVAAYYLELSTEAQVVDVLRYYETLWPAIEALVRRHAEDESQPRLILEGSAIWPERAATLDVPGVAAVWLTAPPALFEARILAESGHAQADVRGRALIEAFLARTLAFDAGLREAAERLGAPLVSMGEAEARESAVAAARPVPWA